MTIAEDHIQTSLMTLASRRGYRRIHTAFSGETPMGLINIPRHRRLNSKASVVAIAYRDHRGWDPHRGLQCGLRIASSAFGNSAPAQPNPLGRSRSGWTGRNNRAV